MPVRLRKFLGAIMLIVLVVAWALVAMALAQSPLIKANGVIEVLYYAIAGLGWVLRPCRSFAGSRAPTPSR